MTQSQRKWIHTEVQYERNIFYPFRRLKLTCQVPVLLGGEIQKSLYPATQPLFFSKGNQDTRILVVLGFDWLFSYPIAGLIPAWGGANSHMAIRAGELGLPAVIGAGEINYKNWSSAKRLHLNCAERRVEVFA